MKTPDFGTKLEAIKHIGNMIDGKMVCIENCPSVTHNTPDTEIENLENELYAENFNLVQNEYARFLDIVTKHFTKLRSSRDTCWKERVRKEVEGMRKEFVAGEMKTQREGYLFEDPTAVDGYNQALDTLLDNLK